MWFIAFYRLFVGLFALAPIGAVHFITGTHTRTAGGSAPPRHRVFARFRATLRTRAIEDAPAALGGASPAPRGLRAFLGVMSDARDRRDALRATWFPDTAALQRCVAAPGQHHTPSRSCWLREAAVCKAALVRGSCFAAALRSSGAFETC